MTCGLNDWQRTGCPTYHIRFINNPSVTTARVGFTFCLSFTLVFLTIQTLISFAWAADVKIVPGISVGAAYEDNIFFATDDENQIDSSIITVSPFLNLDYETLLSHLKFKANWDILNYLDESDLNRTNQYYRLVGDTRLKERWTVDGEINYFHDTTLNTYLQDTGRVVERLNRDYFYIDGTLGYSMTPRSGFNLGYQYQTAIYEDDFYSSWDRHVTNLYYFHQLKTEVDQLYIGPSYYHRTDDFNDVDSLSLDVGWRRDWSSTTAIDFTIGGRYITVSNESGEDQSRWGAKGGLNIKLGGIASSTSIRYFHDLRTTAEGDDVNVDNLYIAYSRSLTERFNIAVSSRLAYSYKLFEQDSAIDDALFFWLEPTVSYDLTQNLWLSLRYRYYNNVTFSDSGDQNRDRNVIWLQLSYGIPFLL